MAVTVSSLERSAALARAEAHAPFLRAAAAAFPSVARIFVDEGGEAAVSEALGQDHPDVAARLRRRRHALALAVALADLSGAQPLEWVTAALSDFADAAMHQALEAALLERVPDAAPTGLAILALG